MWIYRVARDPRRLQAAAHISCSDYPMLRLATQTRTAHGHVPAAASVSSHAHLRETAGGGCALGRTRHEVSVCSIPRRLAASYLGDGSRRQREEPSLLEYRSVERSCEFRNQAATSQLLRVLRNASRVSATAVGRPLTPSATEHAETQPIEGLAHQENENCRSDQHERSQAQYQAQASIAEASG